MKKKAAAFLAGLALGLVCFLGAGNSASAQELPGAVNVTPYTAYLSMTGDTDVYIMPGTSWAVIGRLRDGQPAIATGKTDNGWVQIYYIGMIGYVPGDSTEAYTVPEPTIWGNIAIEGDIKINALGDSITYGDKLKNREAAYPYVVSAKTGAVKLNNYGWNGSSVAGPHPDRLIDRYPSMDPDANLILVLGGTNDYGEFNKAGTPVGAMGDLTPDTFYGSLNLLMCGLQQMYPDGEIVFMTPLRRVGYMRRNQNGYYLNQYASAIQDMAAFWGLRVIDLFNEPELDFSSRQALYLVDGLHPNATGHALLGACVYHRLFENFY